jgi:hypothetical protein
MTESATFADRVSVIRSSIVAGKLGQIRMAMLDRYGYRACQLLEDFTSASVGGLVHALDERHGIVQRNLARP